MHLRTIQYFVAIADAGSLTSAAAAIPIAQPALTRQMRELEAEMGVQLLQRMPRGIRLTRAGMTFYESSQRILAEVIRLRQRLSTEQVGVNTTVVMGTSPTLARVLLPGLLESCFNTPKGIHLSTREAFTPALLDWLETSTIDMAIVTNPDPERALTYQLLLSEPLVLASHKSLRIGPVVSVNQLSNISLLMTSLHRGIVERQMSLLGKPFNVHTEIDSVDSIRELLLRGKWATIMPVSVFNARDSSPEIVLSEISGIQLSRNIVLATRPDPRPHSAFRLVHGLIEAEFSLLIRQGIFSLRTSLKAETLPIP